MSQSSASIARAIAIVTALVIGSFLLLVNFSLPQGNSTYAAIQNFGHFLLFAVLGWIALATVSNLLGTRRFLTLVISVGVLVLLGIGVELFQTGQANRSASLYDFALDVVGIIVGFSCFGLYRVWRAGKHFVATMIIGAVLAITAVACRPVIPLLGFDLLRPDYPVIRNFVSKFADQKIESVGGAIYSTVADNIAGELPSGCCVLRVTFARSRFSGVIFEEYAATRSGKWSDFEFLSIRIYSSLPASRQIALRINDRLHNNQYSDRYNTTLVIEPGVNQFKVRLQQIQRMGREEVAGRIMDIDDVARIQIFASDVDQPFTLDLLNIELE